MFEKILSLEITPRMQQVRTEIMRHPVATATDTYSDLFYPLYSGDRWLTKAWLEGWINGAGEATTQLRAAHAEAYALDHSEPVIGSYDLIAGQPYFPTLSQEEMQQMHRMAAEFRTYVTSRTRGRDDHVRTSKPTLWPIPSNLCLRCISNSGPSLLQIPFHHCFESDGW